MLDVRYHGEGMRTTIDIDAPLLHDMKRLQRDEGKSLARVLNELLAAALRDRRAAGKRRKKLKLPSKAMGARVDVEDREAVWALLSKEDGLR